MSKEDVRTRILSAAGPVFAGKGYEAATVREICQKADANVAAVNYYFGDKERLYIETVKRAHQPEDEPEPVLTWPPDASPETKLTDYVQAMLRRMLSKRAPWQRQLMMRELLNPTAACRELVQVHFRVRFGQLLEILDEIVPGDMPPQKRHQIGFSVVGQCLYYHVAGDVVGLLVGEAERAAHYQLDQLAEHVAQFTLAAMGLRPPLGAARKQPGSPVGNSDHDQRSDQPETPVTPVTQFER